MNQTQRQNIEVEIDRLEAILDGETVDGCVLGENGLTAEWLERQERNGDDGPRETGSGHDDRPWEHSRAYQGCRYSEAELAENGVETNTGYHLF